MSLRKRVPQSRPASTVRVAAAIYRKIHSLYRMQCAVRTPSCQFSQYPRPPTQAARQGLTIKGSFVPESRQREQRSHYCTPCNKARALYRIYSRLHNPAAVNILDPDQAPIALTRACAVIASVAKQSRHTGAMLRGEKCGLVARERKVLYPLNKQSHVFSSRPWRKTTCQVYRSRRRGLVFSLAQRMPLRSDAN